MGKPEIDHQQAERHLAAVDGSTDNFIFAAFADPKGLDLRPWHRLGRFADLVADMERLQAQCGGIFVAVNAFVGKNRRKAETARIRALWGERATGHPQYLERLGRSAGQGRLVNSARSHRR